MNNFQDNAGFRFDSAYASQLRSGFPMLRFSPELEARFRRYHAERSRVPVRRVLLMTLALLMVFRALTQVTGQFGSASLPDVIRFAVVLPVLVLTIGVSYSPRRIRLFRALVIAFALVFAGGSLVVSVLVEDRVVEVGVTGLLLLLIIQHFLLGLLTRQATLISVVLTTAYGLLGTWSGLSQEIVLFGTTTLAVATLLCATASYVLEHSMRSAWLEGQLLAEMVERDPLTGLYNRLAFDKYIQRAWAVGKRSRQWLAFMLIDIDFFKNYNDHNGHQAGDECLRRVARTIEGFVRRPMDFAGRYGGEEFILLLSDVESEQAVTIAEDLRKAVMRLNIPHGASQVAPIVTISIGVSSLYPAETDRSTTGAIQVADEGLYQAKKQGRNRVVMRDADDDFIQTGVFSRQV